MKERIEDFYKMLELDRKNSARSKLSTLKSRYEDLEREVHELKLAIDKNDDENLKEELGDALWDLLFLMIIAEEKGKFTSKEVIEGAMDKLKRRKPWIFEGKEISMEEETERWHEAKRKEKK